MGRNCRRYFPDSVEPGKPIWQAPSRPPLTIDECPTSFVTGESLALAADFMIAQQIRRGPLSGGFYAWPARLVDAWLALGAEFALWQQRETERRSRR